MERRRTQKVQGKEARELKDGAWEFRLGLIPGKLGLGLIPGSLAWGWADTWEPGAGQRWSRSPLADGLGDDQRGRDTLVDGLEDDQTGEASLAEAGSEGKIPMEAAGKGRIHQEASGEGVTHQEPTGDQKVQAWRWQGQPTGEQKWVSAGPLMEDQELVSTGATDGEPGAGVDQTADREPGRTGGRSVELGSGVSEAVGRTVSGALASRGYR